MESTATNNGKNAGTAIAKKGSASTEVAKAPAPGEMFAGFGFKPQELAAKVETVQTGGIPKWLEMKGFLKEGVSVGDRDAVTADQVNGRYVSGWLLGRQDIPDEKGVETNDDGEKVRFYYLLQIVNPAPVSYKNDNDERVFEEAQPGEVIHISERFNLQRLKGFCDELRAGAKIAVGIKPVSRRKIKGGNTMWTFFIEKFEAVPPRTVVGEVVTSGNKTPF